MSGWLLVAAAMMAATTGVAAARELAVPAGKGWQHAETGVILMPTIAGLTRTELSDATAGEFDVTARYEAADKSVITTLFLFHPATDDVALWFDRSRAALEANDDFRGMSPASAAPVAFAAPGATAASSLRQVYASAGGRFRSTGLAVVPVGEWLVALRMTAPALNATQLGERMAQVIAGVRWPPAGMAGTAAAVPVAACAEPLRYAKAKMVKADLADVLIGLSLATRSAGEKAGAGANSEKSGQGAPATWCRDAEDGGKYGVYRAGGATDSYLMALGDAGRVIHVTPSLMGQVNKTGAYAVTLTDVDGSASTFPSFNKMPAPAQVWSTVAGGKPSARAQGKQVTLDAGAL
ncbi:hypothetical protein [Sphingomonas sp.]|uniref:hypothetical protein n=1 Tax=Sphingomonas sp. TaxID=28214 RepID=UPI0035C7B13C